MAGAGGREGHGVCQYVGGDCYEGTWASGQRVGHAERVTDRRRREARAAWQHEELRPAAPRVRL